MGNILSGEDKLPQHKKSDVSYEKRSHGIVWIDDQCGYRQQHDNFVDKTSQQRQQPRVKNKRNVSLNCYDEKREIQRRPRSHSLDAIIEELYLSGTDEAYCQGHSEESYFADKKSYIPRIKLTRNTSNKECQQPLDMSRRPQVLQIKDSATTSRNGQLKPDKKGCDSNAHSPTSIPYFQDSHNYYEITEKNNENYFTKNFDECMKRLEQIEKEHEMIENDDKKVNHNPLRKPTKRQMTPTDNVILPPEEVTETNVTREKGNAEAEMKKTNKEVEEKTEVRYRSRSLSHINADKEEDEIRRDSKVVVNGTCNPQTPASDVVNIKIVDAAKPKIAGTNDKPKLNSPTGWYSNLKKQFEQLDEEFEKQPKTKEAPCRTSESECRSQSDFRATGTTDAKETRHYFSRLVRSNKSLIDEELPDPDKVQNIRAMFQESLNTTLKKKLKLGGSLQNISVKIGEPQLTRPMSAEGNRSDVEEYNQDEEKEIARLEKTEPEAQREADESRQIKSEKEATRVDNDSQSIGKHDQIKRVTDKESQTETVKKPEGNKNEKTNKPDLRSKKLIQPKWTDTGSMSSGVSSDLSSYDDAESCSREGTEQEANISDDDLRDEVDDKHYIQHEILEKIRSFGTSVTYYGGQMITCSVGPLLSPTTQAIMEEIGQKYPNRNNVTRTFDEFYRKYTETNETKRNKKLGRTRSFGQNDVFQKPNVLNDTEIEMYKNDLETEFGIRKPTGKPQNGVRMKLYKSNSLGSRLELSGREEIEKKLAEIAETPEKTELTRRESEGKIAVREVKESTPRRRESNGSVVENQVSIIEKRASKGSTPERRESLPEAEETERRLRPDENEPKPSEILFGYEKNLLNKKRKSDMEFEEFEVCETISEKLEKLQENKENTPDYRITIHINQDEPTKISIEEPFEEIIINDQDPLDSLEMYLKSNNKTDQEKIDTVPKRKWNIDLNKEKTPESEEGSSAKTEVTGTENRIPSSGTGGETERIDTQSDSQSRKTKPDGLSDLDSSSSASESGSKELENVDTDSLSSRRENQEDESKKERQQRYDKNRNLKYNTSRWPIETSVMVDIQKNEQLTPKLVTNGKSLVKTKRRLF